MQAQEGVSTDSGASQAEGLPIRERFSITPGDAGVPHGVRAFGEVLRGRECAKAVGLQASGAADSEEWRRSMRAAVRGEGEFGAGEEGREPVLAWGGGGGLAAEEGPLGAALSRALESEDAERERGSIQSEDGGKRTCSYARYIDREARPENGGPSHNRSAPHHKICVNSPPLARGI